MSKSLPPRFEIFPDPANSRPEVSELDQKITDADAEADTKKCPFCRETILADAIKCKHCHSALVPIAENFAVSSKTEPEPPAPAQSKSGYKEYTIVPPVPSDTLQGHRWGGLAVSLLFLVFTAESLEKPAIAVTFSFIGLLIVGPWMIWVLTKIHTNKELPVTALCFSVLGFFGSLGS